MMSRDIRDDVSSPGVSQGHLPAGHSKADGWSGVWVVGGLEEVQAAARRLEALQTDALAREPRFKTLTDMARDLEQGSYHSTADVTKR